MGCIIAFTACQKEGIIKYEAEANVFFPHTNNIDTIGYTFSKDTLKIDTIKLVVNRMGKVPQGRSFFKLAFDETSTGRKDIDFIMPADTALYFARDSMVRTLRVLVKRASDIREKSRKIELSLKPDEYYNTNLQPLITAGDTIRYQKITITIDDILIQPAWWASYVSYLGTFSRKKTERFVKFLNGLLSYKAFVTSGSSYSGIIRDQSKLFQVYLKQQAAAGATVYEENGDVMVMGASAQ